MPAKPTLIVLAALLLTISVPTSSQNIPTLFSSGQQRVTLLELYTSEGCSSCPPADAWLSDLKADERLWKAFIPIALHVDYWDYIGWRDRFASADYTQRQKRYADEGGARVVYTPGFFSNGKDWTGWRYGRPIERQVMNAGDLRLSVDGKDITVRFAPAREHDRGLRVNVALLGMNLETPVKAGENHGRVLRHDFVVLGLASTSLEETVDGYVAVTTLPDAAQHAEDLAVVAWVAEIGQQSAVQAVGGYLP